MKKIWVSILLVCYLAVSSGVTVNFHYCMNELASTELFDFPGDECGKCGMSMHKAHGCCRDEVKIVKMENDQKLNPAISFKLPSLDLLSIVPSVFIATSFHNVAGQGYYQNHSPPLITEENIYLQNCVFRI